MFNGNVERTQKTTEFYLYRAELLWERAAKENGVPPSMLSPLDFIKWIDSLFFELAKRSRRVYLASIRTWLLYMQSQNIAHGGDSKALEEAIIKSKEIKSKSYEKEFASKSEKKAYLKSKKKEPGKTSSRKEKSVDLVELFNMEEELEEVYTKSKQQPLTWTEYVFTFIYANILVGLRPCEWRRAYLEIIEVEVDGKLSNHLCLVIYNAKNTNGRSHGEKRHIVLTGMHPHEQNMIKKQLNSIKEYRHDDNSWAYYYNAISAEFRRLTRKYLFRPGKNPTYPTLYSTRHQFVANAKFAGFEDDEIGAMLGHATDLTSSLHYANRHQGTGGFCVKPIALEVAKIKNVKRPNKYAVAYSQACRM
jgi:hypothetical protein